MASASTQINLDSHFPHINNTQINNKYMATILIRHLPSYTNTTIAVITGNFTLGADITVPSTVLQQ